MDNHANFVLGTPFQRSAFLTIVGGVLLFMVFRYMTLPPAPRPMAGGAPPQVGGPRPVDGYSRPQTPRDQVIDKLPKGAPQKTDSKEVAKVEQAKKDSAYDDAIRAGKAALEAAKYKEAMQSFAQAARIKPGDGEAARLIKEVKDEETKKKASPFDGRWTPPTRLRPAFTITQRNTTISGTYYPADGSRSRPFHEGKLLQEDELLIAVTNEHEWCYSIKFKLLESGDAEVFMWISPDDAQHILRTAANLGKTPQDKRLALLLARTEVENFKDPVSVGMFRRTILK